MSPENTPEPKTIEDFLGKTLTVDNYGRVTALDGKPLPETPTKYRRHNWLNTETMTIQHGIQAKAAGFECRWLHCAEDGKPLLFDTEVERDAKLKELRKAERRARK